MKTKDIAEFLAAELVGDPDVEITGMAAVDSAKTGDIVYLSKDVEVLSSASAAIVPKNFDRNSTIPLIKASDPKLAFTLLSGKIFPKSWPHGWHESAVVPEGTDVRASYIGPFVSIGAGTQIGEASIIHAGVRIGDNVTIKKCTVIYPNCVIYDGSTIGNDCVIQAGSTIGSDGFGYVKAENGEHRQFPQIGAVIIEDDVEIGANCTVDRGSLGITRIGRGTKIDNMVHIAHNVQIGERVLIAGQSGIAGSTVIEDDVVIAGQVGISDHVRIRSGAVIGAKSVVFPNKVIRSGVWAGIPVQPVEKYLRQTSLIKGLEGLNREVSELRKIKGDAS